MRPVEDWRWRPHFTKLWLNTSQSRDSTLHSLISYGNNHIHLKPWSLSQTVQNQHLGEYSFVHLKFRWINENSYIIQYNIERCSWQNYCIYSNLMHICIRKCQKLNKVFIGGCSATQILMFTQTLEIKQSIYWWL